MSVIAPAGIVGRLVVPSLRSAKVQLLIDRNAAAGAIMERTRAQGVVVGAGADRLRLDYVSDVAVAAALALQTTAARLLVRGSVSVDLVLVVVVYVALTSGPATGLMSGAFAGLVGLVESVYRLSDTQPVSTSPALWTA